MSGSTIEEYNHLMNMHEVSNKDIEFMKQKKLNVEEAKTNETVL